MYIVCVQECAIARASVGGETVRGGTLEIKEEAEEGGSEKLTA